MNRRTLIKTSSLFALTSIFSASISAIGSRRANAQQFRRVNSDTSSCAKSIDAVFQRYRLRVESFDIRYYDGSGHYYMYASSGSSIKSIKKNDGQPDTSLPSISLDTYSSFDNSRSTLAQQQSLDGQVFNGISQAMASENVTLHSAQVSATGPGGRRCYIIFPCDSGRSYCPR